MSLGSDDACAVEIALSVAELHACLARRRVTVDLQQARSVAAGSRHLSESTGRRPARRDRARRSRRDTDGARLVTVTLGHRLRHLDALGSESIHIVREVVAEFEPPAVLFGSAGTRATTTSTSRCSRTACASHAHRASPSTSPTDTSRRRDVASSSRTDPVTFGTPVTPTRATATQVASSWLMKARTVPRAPR
jgi:hypothetical protein